MTVTDPGVRIVAELSAPCPSGVDDCIKLQQAVTDRGGRLMLSWRETAPSDAVGLHVGVVSSASVMQRARVAANGEAPIRVLLGAPRKYAVLLKEASTWTSTVFDASTPGQRDPVLSGKTSTILTDDLVRSFTMMLSVSSTSGDNELTTLRMGVQAGTIDLGAGLQASVVPLPAVPGVGASGLRQELVSAPGSLAGSRFLFLGVSSGGQGIRALMPFDGSGNFDNSALLGTARTATADPLDCRRSLFGFPSVFGASDSNNAPAMGWLDSDDIGAGCNLLVDGVVFNTLGTHVRKAVMNRDWVVWEQQSASAKSGPTEVVARVRSPGSATWGAVARLSTLPVSELLAQASGPPSWAAIAWRECASTAADAACTAYIAKSQTSQTAAVGEIGMTKSSATPLMAIDYYGNAVAVWVEPRGACKADATKACAQIRARWF